MAPDRRHDSASSLRDDLGRAIGNMFAFLTMFYNSILISTYLSLQARYFLYFVNFANFAKFWVLNLAFREIPKAQNFVHCRPDVSAIFLSDQTFIIQEYHTIPITTFNDVIIILIWHDKYYTSIINISYI